MQTTGASPAELLIGRRPRNVFDLIKPDVQRTVAAAQTRQEENYNTRVRKRKFEEGEEVWVRTFSKNEAKWSLGAIIKALGPVTYLIRVGDQSYKSLRHVDQIYNAMPFRCNLEEEKVPPDNGDSSGSQIKSELGSTPSVPERNDEQEEFETADEAPGTSEAEQSPPRQSPVPETTPPRQHPQRMRKPPNRLEYQQKGNPKGHGFK